MDRELRSTGPGPHFSLVVYHRVLVYALQQEAGLNTRSLMVSGL